MSCKKCGCFMDEYDPNELCASCHVQQVFLKHPRPSDKKQPIVGTINAEKVVVVDEIKGTFNMDDM